MSNMKMLSKLFISAAALVSLISCATVSSPPEQGILPSTSIKQNEGVVFGFLNATLYDSQGKLLPQDSDSNVSFILRFGPSSDNFLAKKASIFLDPGRSLKGNTKSPEFFAKTLPAGDYSIFTLERSTGARSGEAMTAVHFVVAPNKATYIGSIQVEFHGVKGLFGEERSAQRIAINVINEFEKATQQFKQRNPNIGLDITSNLATFAR